MYLLSVCTRKHQVREVDAKKDDEGADSSLRIKLYLQEHHFQKAIVKQSTTLDIRGGALTIAALAKME